MSTTSYERVSGADLERLVVRDDDPPPDLSAVLIYARIVEGVRRTLARFPDGRVIIIL